MAAGEQAMPMLNVTEEEYAWIDRLSQRCQLGESIWDEPLWVTQMCERFDIPLGMYLLQVRHNVTKIPAPGIPRLEP
jgi:hypothetical protein